MRHTRYSPSYGLFYSTLLLWLALDAATKKAAWLVMGGEGVHRNTGIAFGLPVPFALQILGSAALLALFFALALHTLRSAVNRLALSVAFGIIIGGGLGNFLERMFKGSVTDFIVLWPFPLFNIADLGITLGALLLCLHSLKSKP